MTGGGKTVTIPVTITGGDPFVDTEGHWAQDFVTQLYLLGITTGVTEADGQVYFYPNRTITRGELLTLVVRMMGVDATQFANVTLPFADTESIDKNWLLPYVQAAYSLGIFTGAERGGALYADVSTPVTRERTCPATLMESRSATGPRPMCRPWWRWAWSRAAMATSRPRPISPAVRSPRSSA